MASWGALRISVYTGFLNEKRMPQNNHLRNTAAGFDSNEDRLVM
jgi:hypothetical protein